MRRFFADEWQGDLAILRGSEAQHAYRVLRMRVGDEICIARDGNECRCRIESIDKEQTTAILLEERPAPGEPRQDIRLFLAYMKADKM